MQYNNDFHLHHWLVDASQMLGEFESFYCNRNVDNVYWYEKLNFPPAPHLIWRINYQIRGKEFLIVLKSFHGKAGRSCFLGPMSSKVDVMKVL